MADRAGCQGALRYEPARDAAERYTDWVIRHRPLAAGIPEVLCRRRKVILIESRQSAVGKRCSLAHAVAHLDLGHDLTDGIFGRRQELEANQLAARRLLPVESLAEVMTWTRWTAEIAAELRVDRATLECRREHLHPSELAKLKREVAWLEETA